MNKFDLEERLINFSVLVIEITKEMPNNYAANRLAKQLLRSGISVSLNYGQAQKLPYAGTACRSFKAIGSFLIRFPVAW